MNEPNDTLQLTLSSTLKDQRLDHALATLLPTFSRTQLKQWIENGRVLVNGQVVKAKMKIKGGEEVVVMPEARAPLHFTPQPLPLAIVYEDEALLVINKPAGLVVHPGAGNQQHTLLNGLLHYAQQLATLPRAGILHRLDKDTSGLLVVAKTLPAYQHISAQLKKRTVVREYQTIVSGILISGGTINAPIGRHPLQRKRMSVLDNGKPAITHYRVLEKYRAHTRLSVRLETGRTHQIRVHMTFIDHPVVGDRTYGTRIKIAKGMSVALLDFLRQYKRQALHASALGLVHPLTGENMRWEVPLPADMQTLMQLLREDISK